MFTEGSDLAMKLANCALVAKPGNEAPKSSHSTAALF